MNLEEELISFSENIPNGWKIGKFKYLIKLLTDYTANGSFKSLADNVKYLDKGYSRLIRLTDLRKNLKNDGIYLNKESHEFLKKSELFGNEILIANVGAYTGYAIKMECNQGICSLGPNMFLVRNKSEISDLNYIIFSLNSYFIQNQFKVVITSTAQPKINKDNLKSLMVPIPPLRTQTYISKYLRFKTQRIDFLIERIEKKIELLNEQKNSLINQFTTKGLDPNVEMKDSGVDWVRKIPKNWSLKKISHIVNFIGSGSTPKSNKKEYYENGEINWLIIGDLNDHEIYKTQKTITLKALRDTSLKEYPINSLIIAMYGSIGKIGILKVKSTVNQACCVLNFNENQDYYFWFYSFLGIRKYLTSLGYGGVQTNISQETIKELRLPSPSTKSEQTLIAKELTLLSNKINNLIKKYLKKKDLLKEYRQSLISSVVTGKILITEDMI